MESYSRIRSVKLKRPTVDHSLGFSVRGGHEHGTGIFVSSVTPRSIAHRQGLKIGDQILRVNGYPVSIAVHQECLALMRFRTTLHLKVRSVGMIPVREKPGEPLTWRLVEETPLSPECEENGKSGLISASTPPNRPHHQNNTHLPLGSRMSDTSSQPDSRIEFQGAEAKVYINTNGHSGLGCCICKGPPERPGIFVQSTKSSGVAREAGLRPGDQILQCNGHSFLNIPFAEAVYHLKSSRQLNLSVIKGAASDLFPGESSGYNSSASSLNGEAHVSVSSETSSTSTPSEIIVVEQHELPKRLSMVTEEQAGRNEDRGLSRKSKSIVALDRNMEWDEVEQVWHSAEKESIIIEVKGEDPNSKIRNEEVRLLEERRKLEAEQRRLMEEAVRLEEEKRKFEEEKRKTHQKTDSLPSRSSSSSSNDSLPHNHDLAGALTQEILKRNERREIQQLQQREDSEEKAEIGERAPGTDSKKLAAPFTAPVDDAKRQQHEQLIEEFKKAHRKMFAQSLEDEQDGKNGFPPREERASFRAKRIQKEVEHARKMVEQRVAGIVRQRQLRIERQHQEVQETEREVTQHVIRKNTPPPPPPPVVDAPNITEASNRTPESRKPPPGPNSFESVGRTITQEVLDSRLNLNGMTKDKPISNGKLKSDATEIDPEDRPESPSPDYSNSPSPIPDRRRKDIGMEKVVRLTAYPSVYSRPEPSRLEFLKESSSGNGISREDMVLQRELENALARCQLTRPVQSEIKTNRNGQVTIQLGNNNRPMNNNSHVNGKPSGILKNSSSHSGSEHGSSSGNLKSISFGQF